MEANRIAAIVLIVLGALGLAYGGFSYKKETHEANVGSLHLSVSENRHVNVPVWVGAVAIMLGGVLLVTGLKR